ncbi:TolC family protein [Thermodesulfobacteriota bacterium]
MEQRARPATTITAKNGLTLEECTAIALKRNLELQAARFDEITKQAIHKSSSIKILPTVVFSGELSERDAPRYSFSDVLGQEGMHPNPAEGPSVRNWSTGSERSLWRYNVGLRWSLTDTALAYYVSRSSRNDRIIAHYKKVRTAQKLVGAVEAAFFRLVGLQSSVAIAKEMHSVRKRIAKDAKDLHQDQLLPVEELQKALQEAIDAEQILSKIYDDLEAQRNTLASLMGVSPDYCVDGGFYVVGCLSAPHFNVPPCKMEMTAAQNRPELFESGLKHLNSVNDWKRTIVKYFPRVTGFWKVLRDNDKFLYEKDWKEVGLLVHFDLVEWLANLKESGAARSEAAKTDKDLAAAALALTTQVRTAALRYGSSLKEVNLAERALRGHREVWQAVRARYLMQDADKLTLEAAHAEVLNGRIRTTIAVGNANAALANLKTELGTNYNEPLH